MNFKASRKNSVYYKLIFFTPPSIYVSGQSLISNLKQTDQNMLLISFLCLFVLVCTLILINAIVQVLKKSPAIILSDEGLADNLNNERFGPIAWSNITSCELKKYVGSTHLVVKLKDHSKIVERRSGIKRSLIETKVKDLGTPIALNASLIDYDAAALLKEIQNRIPPFDTNVPIRGQTIKKLYASSGEDNWALMITDQAAYELRLGGIKLTAETRSDDYLMDLDVKDKTIKALKTDEFTLYFELENGECLIHSESWIDGDGNVDFAIKLLSKSEFDQELEEWYDGDSDLVEIE